MTHQIAQLVKEVYVRGLIFSVTMYNGTIFETELENLGLHDVSRKAPWL